MGFRGRRPSLRSQIKHTLVGHFPFENHRTLDQVTQDILDVFWASEPETLERWGPPEDGPEKEMLEKS